MRRIFSVLAVVTTVALVATAGLAPAQEDQEPPPPETVTVTFALTVVGQPPPDATFFGFIGFELFGIRLTDPDGDGVFTGSFDNFPRGDTQPFFIVQGTGTRPSVIFGEAPCEPTTITRDFGLVTIDQDTRLSASVSFGQASGGSANLPSTGGPNPILLAVAGALLLVTTGGVLFLVRRFFGQLR